MRTNKKQSRLSFSSPSPRRDADLMSLHSPPFSLISQAKSSSPTGPSSSTRNLRQLNTDDSMSDPRPRKRIKRSGESPEATYQYDASCESISAPQPPLPSRSHNTSHTGASRKGETACLLMIAAQRSSSAAKAKTTHRHLMAFGVKVPSELSEVKEFAIPAWVTGKDEDSSEHLTHMLERLDVHLKDASTSNVVPTS